MVKMVLDHMKPYMNIELFQLEHQEKNKEEEGKQHLGAAQQPQVGTGTREPKSGTVVENALFQYQSKIGHATGKAQSPLWFREALAKHIAAIEARKPKKMYLSADPNVLG